jgi:hypothetical protein
MIEKEKQLKTSLSLARKMVGCTEINKNYNLAKDIIDTFPDVHINTIIEVIGRGAKGMYGRTYRFSFQEVSIWIREYYKNIVSSN